MINNGDIADILTTFAKLSELHNGNPFKIKSISAAAFRIDKLTEPLFGKQIQELESIDGIGKSIAQIIFEICTTNSFKELQLLINQTPQGVLELMKIKGLGPKKIAFIWKELGIESIGEMLYACRENRLAQAKGFGIKTQENVIKQIEFMYASANQFHYFKLVKPAKEFADLLSKLFNAEVAVCGDMARKLPVMSQLVFLLEGQELSLVYKQLSSAEFLKDLTLQHNHIKASFDSIPIEIYASPEQEFYLKQLELSSSEVHFQALKLNGNFNYNSVAEVYVKNNYAFVEPELRETSESVRLAQENKLPDLITFAQLKGALHNHSTWSDGLNSIEEMAKFCMAQGWQYLGMADHSKAAFYANGLSEERVLAQQSEIDKLNSKLHPFKIFKGIECDILNDGQLDYSEDILKTFDYVVASVHTNLKMNEEKAMARLIKAVENPYTTILGHPTGRLLLMREGYAVNHKKLIDACAANNVSIEINANPYRLDLDWKHVAYALEKGVKLCINPDAHELTGLLDMHWGVATARKGGLTAADCLNAYSLNDLSDYFTSKKP